MSRKILCEALGALLLTACVVGSGIMAERASTHIRSGSGQWMSEVVATGGLIFVAFRSGNFTDAAWRVALWIGAAYWFTASTSFANPAITIGRSLSDTFAGIRPADAPGFIAAQVAGGVVGVLLLRLIKPEATA